MIKGKREKGGEEKVKKETTETFPVYEKGHVRPLTEQELEAVLKGLLGKKEKQITATARPR